MPGRVATFFRAHTSDSLPTEFKKKTRKLSASKTTRPTLPDRTPSSSSSSLSSEADRSVKMHDNSALKRLSLNLHSPKTSSTKIPQHAASFDIVIESPPLIFYGAAGGSTGALLSGQLKIHVHEDAFAINSFKMVLNSEIFRKKPFHAKCEDCQTKITELNNWNFLQGPGSLRRGEHSYPFSFLFPGELPASHKSSLESVSYVLRAVVTPISGEPLKLSQTLDLKRAILPPEFPRNSVRIFPPTNLTANCELPALLHPIGENKVSMRMDGVVKRNPDGKSQLQWKLKRMTWRIDEHVKTVSPACPKHAAKLGPEATDEKKKAAHSDVRTIGTEDLKDGWKADYTTPDGSIELEFPIGIKSGSKPICDVKARDGTEIMHVLIVEMIVAEEMCPMKKPKQITPTGAARVLRMHFNVTLTERAGMGISWDKEQPPLYENVPASPPAYAIGDVLEGPIPDYEDLYEAGESHQVLEGTTPWAAVTENGEGPARRRLSVSDLELEVQAPEEEVREVQTDDSQVGVVEGTHQHHHHRN